MSIFLLLLIGVDDIVGNIQNIPSVNNEWHHEIKAERPCTGCPVLQIYRVWGNWAIAGLCLSGVSGEEEASQNCNVERRVSGVDYQPKQYFWSEH